MQHNFTIFAHPLIPSFPGELKLEGKIGSHPVHMAVPWCQALTWWAEDGQALPHTYALVSMRRGLIFFYQVQRTEDEMALLLPQPQPAALHL